ncbi:Uncharacterised protein [Alistipes sp. cv1]|jgi:hypothetical protein|nr:Uncharacterised protein [Faecalibacterium prausnitzii]
MESAAIALIIVIQGFVRVHDLPCVEQDLVCNAKIFHNATDRKPDGVKQFPFA